MRNTNKDVKVYSYIRFSTPEQAMGDSERRQHDAAKKWADRNGLQLDDNTLMDRGLSGYHGHHRKRGALGDFLKQVEDNRVPEGSILLVENLDRLSREGTMDVFKEVMFKLWNKGITLQTLVPEERFEPGCDNDPKLLGLLFGIQRARAESQRKSELMRAARTRAFDAAREHGRLVTTRGPAWLHVVDGVFNPIPEAATAVRLIFQWKLEGMGQLRIERRLNAESPWSPPPVKLVDHKAGKLGNGWRQSYVKKILNNRAVIGEYQPHRRIDGRRKPDGPAIPNYYPSVVERDVFFEVQEQLERNRGKGGRTGKKRNLFTHLAHCAYCGGPMRFIDKGKPEWRYLTCEAAARGLGCQRVTIRYAEVEDLILDNCHLLRPSDVLSTNSEQKTRCDVLLARIETCEHELLDIGQRIANYEDQIGRTGDAGMRDRYETSIIELTQEQEGLATKCREYRSELQLIQTTEAEFSTWQGGLKELREKTEPDNAVELRIRLANHLRDFIDRIEIFPIGFAREWGDEPNEIRSPRAATKYMTPRLRRAIAKRFENTTGDDIGEILGADAGKASEMQLRFVRYTLERRMSKEGRFVRAWFKSGEHVDLVPAGSFATGWSAIGNRVERRLPSLEKLLNDFYQEISPLDAND